MRKVVAIIDGFNAGRFFPKQLKNRNIDCIHVVSASMLEKKFQADNYLSCYSGDVNNDVLVKEFMSDNYEVMAVIPGSESGVELAHSLAKFLHLRRNNDDLVSARRNKYDMCEAVKNYGLRIASHYKTANLDELLAWASKHGSFPVVVKPLDSGGSDNVHICHDIEAVNVAFKDIKDKKTIYGNNSSEVLIQEYLEGEEYVVNLVSYESQHFVLEVRQYHKQTFNMRHIYDFEELLDFQGPVQQQLIDYAKGVASAVGIQFGPSHIEIIMTDAGPVLVEIAARISGATNVKISNEALGYNVVDLTIDSYLEEIASVSNKLRKKELIIDIATNLEGRLKAIPFKESVKSFSSVKNAYFKLDVGDYIVPTISLPTSPVKLHMLHTDRDQLLRDKDALKQAAHEGFVV